MIAIDPIPLVVARCSIMSRAPRGILAPPRSYFDLRAELPGSVLLGNMRSRCV